MTHRFVSQGGADMQWRFPICSGPASPALQSPSAISFEEPHTFRVPAATLQVTRALLCGISHCIDLLQPLHWPQVLSRRASQTYVEVHDQTDPAS